MERIMAGDPETRSEDVVDDNLERLKALFPEAFTQGRVDFEVLRQLLGDAVDEREEKYGLNWHGKRRARQLALTPSIGTLRPCPKDSVDWDTTQNLMIEGDNLEVLKLLQKSYAGKVKLIYIDPPYNKGKDFIYRDNYRDNIGHYLRLTGQTDNESRKISSNTELSGRFHTDWMNMMYPRLKLARTLLRPDGAIFVTIDDREVAHLKILMDEIWGDENCVCLIAWQKVFAKKNKALVSGSHDHILVYTKSIDYWSRNLLPRSESQFAVFRNRDQDSRGRWQSVSFSVSSEDAERRREYRYEITLPSGRKVKPPIGRHWNGLEDRYEELRNDNRFWFGEDGDSLPRVKVFLSEVQQGIVPDTWWRHEDTGNNQEAKKELLELFGDNEPFSTPKPTRLVERILRIATNENEDLVLDFFAGSGTTAHSVMNLNCADDGSRRFILVQLPEPTGRDDYPTIADITKDRIRNVNRSLRRGHSTNVLREVAAVDLGFRVFKLDSSNIRAWDPKPDDLDGALLSGLDHIEPGRTEQDILFELLLKLGLDLCVPIETRTIAGKSVHSVGAGTMIACLDEDVSRDDVEPLATGIADWHDALAPVGECTVVFRDSAFADDVAKTNLAETLKQRGLGNVRSL